jgi:hypothetical protein
MITYRNYHPVAYPDEKLVPVPGWGMHPILAGNPVIGISGIGAYARAVPSGIRTVPSGIRSVPSGIRSGFHAMGWMPDWRMPEEWVPIVPESRAIQQRLAVAPCIRVMPRYVEGILSTPRYDPRFAPGGLGSLGMDIPIKTPVGTQHIDVPIEAIANKAVEAAWPSVQQKLQAEATSILNKAQPRLRTEIDRGLKEAKKTGYILGFMIVASVVGAAWWVKKGK